jgi:uncharacterized membrane protein
MVPYLILKVLHISCAAAWFGYGVGLAGDVRRTLALGRPHTESLVARTSRSTRVTIICGWLTFLTGVGVIFATKSVGSIPGRILAGGALTLVMFAIGGSSPAPPGTASCA